MKALRRIRIVLALTASLVLAAGCGMSRIKDIRLTDMGVKYIVPTSGRSMDAVLRLEIDNPAIGFRLQDVRGTIFLEERPVATFTAGPVTVEPKCRQSYEMPGSLTLEPQVSLLNLLIILAKNSSLEGFQADVDLYVANKHGTIGAPLSFKKMDLSQFAR